MKFYKRYKLAPLATMGESSVEWREPVKDKNGTTSPLCLYLKQHFKITKLIIEAGKVKNFLIGFKGSKLSLSYQEYGHRKKGSSRVFNVHIKY